jgi:hypothetical protein
VVIERVGVWRGVSPRCRVGHAWTLGLVRRLVTLSGPSLQCPFGDLVCCYMEIGWITETLLTMRTLRVARSETHLLVPVEQARSPIPRDQPLPTPPARFSATLADIFLALHALRYTCSQILTNRVVIITSLKYLRLDLLHKT